MGEHDIKVDMAKLKFVDEPVRTSATTHHQPPPVRPIVRPRPQPRRARRKAVVSEPCGAERRQQGTAQEHAAVQVQLIGLTKEKAPACRGFFFFDCFARSERRVAVADRIVKRRGSDATNTFRFGPLPSRSSLPAAVSFAPVSFSATAAASRRSRAGRAVMGGSRGGWDTGVARARRISRELSTWSSSSVLSRAVPSDSPADAWTTAVSPKSDD